MDPLSSLLANYLKGQGRPINKTQQRVIYLDYLSTGLINFNGSNCHGEFNSLPLGVKTTTTSITCTLNYNIHNSLNEIRWKRRDKNGREGIKMEVGGLKKNKYTRKRNDI